MSNPEFNTTKTPLILAATGAGGGVLGFFLGEIQSIEEGYRFLEDSLNGATAVWFALVLLGIGSVLAASQGLGEGNTQKAFDTALRAAPAFIVGGAISGYIAQSVYTSMLDIDALSNAVQTCSYDYGCSAIDSVIRPARAVGWMVAGGLGGVALGAGFRSAKRAQNGLIGGLAGGLIGGLLFDSIDNITGISTEGTSRFFAIVLIGTLMGGLTGLLDSVRTEMWLSVTSGEMAGQQFIIYDDATIVGCARNIPVTLMYDRDVSEHHVRIDKTSGATTFTCLNNAKPVLVNGIELSKGQIRNGDIIQIGNTKLVMGERNSSTDTPAYSPASQKRPSLYSTDGAERSANEPEPLRRQEESPPPAQRPSIQMKPKSDEK